MGVSAMAWITQLLHEIQSAVYYSQCHPNVGQCRGGRVGQRVRGAT